MPKHVLSIKNMLKTQKNTQKLTKLHSVTDQPTDRPTDRVTYRVACTRLKIQRNHARSSTHCVNSLEEFVYGIGLDK